MSAKKKAAALAATCAFVALVGAQAAFAVGGPDGGYADGRDAQTGNTAALREGRAANFADADGDGVCDRAAAMVRASFVDADGDGICDNAGQGMHAGARGSNGAGFGWGAGFIDEDGDGVCDNAANGSGGGFGRGFVDSDGDGVCDNAGVGGGAGRQDRGGSGFHGGR